MLADRTIELVGVDAAGILLADSDGNLRVMAASNEQARLLELFQLQNDEGACLDAHSTGLLVVGLDLGAASERWPRFAPEAFAAGFRSVYAIPLRVRSTVIGALNLFRSEPGPISDEDLGVAQALADVASIAILQDQALRASQVRAVELQHALDSRVAIEQAKGMISERAKVGMDEAFRLLRTFARSRNLLLTAVALDVVSGELSLEVVAGSLASTADGHPRSDHR